MRTIPSASATSPAYKASVYIGRFQPFHSGHLSLLARALELAERVVVVLGSSHQARSTKNPFTWEERAAMISLAVGPQAAERITFVPVRDFYDDKSWVSAVRQGVNSALNGERNVALVGHFKDASSYYLSSFPGWNLESCPRGAEIDATALRKVLFQAGAGAEDQVGALAVMGAHIPAPTLSYLKSWMALPYLAELREEWRLLAKEKAAWANAPYAPMFVTVDAVVTCADKVLLVERDRAPGAGLMALPGGFLEQFETLYQGALRELREETGLSLLDQQFEMAHKGHAVFDSPGRSQRGRVITCAQHFALSGKEPPGVKGLDDARSARWVPIAELAAMESRFHDDHFVILNHFLGLLPAA